MKVLYLTNATSQQFYASLFANIGKQNSVQALKYNVNMILGLSHKVETISVLSSLPVNRTTHKQVIFKYQKEIVDNICFHYLPFINLPLLRQISIFFASCFFLVRFRKYNTVLVDSLNIMLLLSARTYSYFAKKPYVTVCTDRYRDIYPRSKIIDWLQTNLVVTAQGCIAVSSSMLEYYNHIDTGIIIESIVHDKIETASGTQMYNVIMYSGGIYFKYGMKQLIDGFLLVNNPLCELWLFGDGDAREYIEEMTKVYKRIKYFGVKNNAYIMDIQRRVKLLINPRPTDEEFVNFSYPSKITEYLLSGSLVATTMLPSIPSEYTKYCIIIDRCDPISIANSIEEGLRAQTIPNQSDYIYEKTNYLRRGEQVADFIRRIAGYITNEN